MEVAGANRLLPLAVPLFTVGVAGAAVAQLFSLGIVARMAIIPFIFVTWLIHAGIAAILSAPIVYFSRKRIHWRRYELLAFIIPFGIWFALCGFTGIRSKTLSNAAIEPAIFGLGVPIAALGASCHRHTDFRESLCYQV
jgi:hypothetical protein